MHSSLQRLSEERIARRAKYVNDLTVLIYKRVNGLSFNDSNNYALLFAEALLHRRCIASPIRPVIDCDFIHIPVSTTSIDYNQSIALLLLLEELLETQMTVFKRIDTIKHQIGFVVIEPVGSGELTQKMTA